MKQFYLKFGNSENLPMQNISVNHIETELPKNQPITGYGSKIPTRYMVIYEGRKRRVYAICFSNTATFYILMNGEKVLVDAYEA